MYLTTTALVGLLFLASRSTTTTTVEAVSLSVDQSSAKTKELFDQFILKYKRQYSSEAERANRFQIFSQNVRRAAEQQALNPMATFTAMNQFGDLTVAEFKAETKANSAYFRLRALERGRSDESALFTDSEPSLNATIDWREKGALTPIKTQGKCGSCWAFSTISNIESQWFLANNSLIELSEQLLVACDKYNYGCGGGMADDAFSWILKNRDGYLASETSYPYDSEGGVSPSCNDAKADRAARITSYKKLPRNETHLAEFVLRSGPIAIGVDSTSLQIYGRGIIQSCVSREVDHAVNIVGFDSTFRVPYWIVRNSWGEYWGEEGYFRVVMGRNQCLLTDFATTAFV